MVDVKGRRVRHHVLGCLGLTSPTAKQIHPCEISCTCQEGDHASTTATNHATIDRGAWNVTALLSRVQSHNFDSAFDRAPRMLPVLPLARRAPCSWFREVAKHSHGSRGTLEDGHRRGWFAKGGVARTLGRRASGSLGQSVGYCRKVAPVMRIKEAPWLQALRQHLIIPAQMVTGRCGEVDWDPQCVIKHVKCTSPSPKLVQWLAVLCLCVSRSM